jgi:type 1 glutamine amidotransferase
LDLAWRIGESLTERKYPTVIVFYGETGHEGKSVAATNISTVLTTAIEWI